MEKKGHSWIIAMTFKFSYISLRVKIKVPLPHKLYCRVKAVFDFFDNKKYMKTPSPLFHDKASKKEDCVLEAILLGGYSDPPGPFCGLYCLKTDAYCRCMVDKGGLWIYCYMIGTSLLESMNQNLTKVFRNTMSGVLYSN